MKLDTRLDSLDVLKGLLVLVMVAYHVFSIASNGGADAVRYLRFVSGSFIFLAGFVAAVFFLPRFAQAPAAATGQLVQRGLKVLALFTALNLAIVLSGFGNLGKPQLGLRGTLAHAATIYGSGDARLSSFLILLPIAYLLLLTPLVLAAFARAPRAAPAALALAALALAQAEALTQQRPIVEFLAIGGVGLAAAAPSVARVALQAGCWPTPAVVAGLAAVLWVAGRFATSGVAYIAGVAAILLLLHALAQGAWAASVFGRELLRLGRCSLFAYIAQIVLIQILFRAQGGGRLPLGPELMLLALLSTALLVGSCIALDRLRATSRAGDLLYRAVFA